ncbi:MAG: nitroreductase family protein [Bacteroidales bacterium]
MEREKIKSLLERRTIRKYSDKDISKETLDLVLEAGIRASNCGNMQAYSIIVTRDIEMKKRMLPLHFGQKMAVEAPVTLTICADMNRFHKWCLQRGTTVEYDNFLWLNIATIDASILSQSISTAAEELGLGICYLGTVNYNAKEISEVLELPNHVVPIACITMGYPNENPPLTERLPLDTFVHYETYKDYTEEDIEKYYKEFEELEQSKKYCKESNKENLAKVFTESRYKGDDSRHFSRKYLEFITKKGFMRNE